MIRTQLKFTSKATVGTLIDYADKNLILNKSHDSYRQIEETFQATQKSTPILQERPKLASRSSLKKRKCILGEYRNSSKGNFFDKFATN